MELNKIISAKRIVTGATLQAFLSLIIEEMESEKTELVRSKNQTNRRIEAMVEEKKDLLNTLKYLQEELVKSGKK